MLKTRFKLIYMYTIHVPWTHSGHTDFIANTKCPLGEKYSHLRPYEIFVGYSNVNLASQTMEMCQHMCQALILAVQTN